MNQWCNTKATTGRSCYLQQIAWGQHVCKHAKYQSNSTNEKRQQKENRKKSKHNKTKQNKTKNANKNKTNKGDNKSTNEKGNVKSFN